MRARLDADLRVHVDDVSFEVRLQSMTAAAAVDMAAAAAGLAPHAVTNRIAHVQSLGLSGSLSGVISLDFLPFATSINLSIYDFSNSSFLSTRVLVLLADGVQASGNFNASCKFQLCPAMFLLLLAY